MGQWIKNIAYYLIFVSFFLMILPSDKYEKYIRIFLGIIYIYIVFEPLLNLFGVNEFIWGNYKKELVIVKEDPSKKISDEYVTVTNNIYKTYLKEEIVKNYSTYNGYNLLDVSVSASYEETTGITLDKIVLTIKKDQEIPVVYYEGAVIKDYDVTGYLKNWLKDLMKLDDKTDIIILIKKEDLHE